MPLTCCVPHCRGNCKNGPKVSVYSFPKEKDLRDRWLAAIRRSSDFKPKTSHRVCSLHFNKEDIEKSAKFFIEQTGEILTVPLKYSRLVEGAVPSKNLPDCDVSHLYYNNINNNGERDKENFKEDATTPKRKKIDVVALQQAYEEKRAYAEYQSLKSLDDIMVKFSKIKLEHWKLVRTDNFINFIHLVETPHPLVKYLVSVSKTLEMSVFSNNVEFKCLSSVKGLVPLPSVTTLSNLEQFLENTYNFFEGNSQEADSLENNCNMAIDILEAVSCKIPEKSITIKHLQEEIKTLSVAAQDCSTIKRLNEHNYCGKGFQLYPAHFQPVNRQSLEKDKMKPKKVGRKPRPRRIETRVRLSLKCDLCPKIFASRSGFANHKLIHQNVPISRNYLCNYCAKSFRTKVQLVAHMRGHTGERPFPCKFCNKLFKMKATLRSHEMCHLGTTRKPYKCETCNKAFSTKGQYEEHRRTHTGEKPFPCNVCGKCFNSRKFWKIHLRMHTGETPFSCPVCGGRYHDKSSLNKHRKAKGHVEEVSIKN